jgi:hypothetical protein
MNIQGFTPQMTAPVQANSVSSRAVGSSTNSGGSTSATSASSLQGTFLNLLVTELQNHRDGWTDGLLEPTRPVNLYQSVAEYYVGVEFDRFWFNAVLDRKRRHSTHRSYAGDPKCASVYKSATTICTWTE